ncbi:MerR family transcriptional regulator [Oceanobacillus rekensis]|uniref:MerR family transcriptional regulator n=1 Tax=Oceanobacillus rekensis TaxID=937927 RepID=UPI000B42F045|nr:MerR family transcriptional regulator [Oceanobacillus rekensis]
MKIYNPADIAELLGVKESTLRKYSILLENAGYQFKRNNQNQRWYNDNDVIALQKLVTLKNNGDMSLKECAEAVCLWARGNDVTQELTVTDNDTERYNNDFMELKEMVQKQNELLESHNKYQKMQMKLIKDLVQRLDQQESHMEIRLKERDKLLMQTISERLETQKQIAAAKEAETEEQQKQGFFIRLFKR